MKQLHFILVLLVTGTMAIAQDIPSLKLFRFGNIGNEKPGAVSAQNQMIDVTAFGEDYNEHFFETNGLVRLGIWLKENQSKCPIVAPTERIASCVARPSKIVAVGLNYAEHIKEGGAPTPTDPVIFLKATSALCGPYDNAIMPLNATKMDWEAELAVVIGKKASYINEKDALNYIAGYTVINDYSERSWQLEQTAGQWDKGKSSDNFAPLGPYFVTPAALGNPQNLKIWLTVNGVPMQTANTNQMIFSIQKLVSEVSKYMTLLPGDVIATGTPSGVGLGHKPPVYLKPNDVVELGIENIGTQKQTVVDAMQMILGDESYKDYQAWVALGVGGIAHTLEGYRYMKDLGRHMGNPLNINLIKGDIGKKGDVKVLNNLPKRQGVRPTIAPFAVPHRQTDQLNSEELRGIQKKIFDEQVADTQYQLEYKMSVFEKHSPAIFLKDVSKGNATLMPLSKGEIGHIHPSDGSMHIILSPSDTKTVIENGWGELHGLAGQGGEMAKTYTMIYSPRDENELAITKKILEAAVKYASLTVK